MMAMGFAAACSQHLLKCHRRHAPPGIVTARELDLSEPRRAFSCLARLFRFTVKRSRW